MLKWLEGLNWISVVSFAVAVEVMITNGTISFTHLLPLTMIAGVKEGAGDLASIGSLIVGAGAMGRVPGNQVIKILLFGLVAGAFMVGSAIAGDIGAALPVKGSSVAPCTVATASTPLSCSGAYAGIGLSGQGSNADIIGSGINGSVFAGGIVPSINAGYQYVQGNWLFGAELDAGYSLKSSAQVNNLGNGFDGARISEVFKVGGNAASLLGNQQPISIPPQLANAVLLPYIHISPMQWQLPGAWAAGTGSGAGVEFDFGPRIFGDLRYTYTDFHGAKAGGVTIQNDQSIRFSVNYKFN